MDPTVIIHVLNRCGTLLDAQTECREIGPLVRHHLCR